MTAVRSDPLPDQAAERSPQRKMSGRPWSRWWPDPWWLGAVLGAIVVAGLVLFFVPLGGVDLGQLNGFGLISVLPRLSLLGVTAAVIAFSVGLCLPRAYPVVLGIGLAGIVVCLDAVTVFTETEPRFPTSYQIAGFTEFVSRTGHTAPGLDAYFSWPGLFAVVAFLQHVTGNHDLIPVMRWWPVTIDMACLAPLYLIMRNIRASWRAKWMAAFLFAVGNWVGQDYFSPQSFNYLLYLAFVAILLTWFGLRPAASPAVVPQTGRTTAKGKATGTKGKATAATGKANGAARGKATPAKGRATAAKSKAKAKAKAKRGGYGILGWLWLWCRVRPGALVPGEIEARPTTRGQRALLLSLLLGIFVYSTTSHQLTPFNMIAACLGLVVVRRCTITGLPVLLAVIVTAWVSFAAVGFWSGHLSALFGDLGNFGGNLTSSVADRVTGTAQHRDVIKLRSAFAAVVLLMAAVGMLRRRRWVIDDRVLITLLVMPFLAFATQSYGGEIALRVYLFALPGAAVLAACLFFPATREDGRSHLWRAIPVAVCSVALLLAFFVARYGNETFERTPQGEVAAFDYLYAHDQGGIRLMWLSPEPVGDNTPQMPWEYRDTEKIEFVPQLAPPDPGDPADLIAALRAQGPRSYLITTTTQESYLNQEANYGADWGARFRAQMAATPGVQVVYANSDAVIYALQFPAGTQVHPFPLSTASSPAPGTIWTPIGLAVLVLLLLVLTTREFVRVCLGAPRRIIRVLTVSSLPLLVAFVVVVVMRFIVIS